MDDILLLQLLKKKGVISERDIHEFHELTEVGMESYPAHSESIYTKQEINHISEQEARNIVSKMYHIENNKKYIGERFDINKAKEVCSRYKGVIPMQVTPCEIYVAINYHYHNYINLFKQWFSDNIDNKIIETAMVFWFMDDDWKYEDKVTSMQQLLGI